MIIKNIVILLSILNLFSSSDVSTCSFSSLDDCSGEEGIVCKKPTTEGKCDNDYQLEMSSGDSSFESVEGELSCDNEQLIGERKGGFKLLDIDAIRCAKEKCKVIPSKGSGKCMPITDCKDATAKEDTMACDAGFHLEVQQTGAMINGWIEVKKMKCSGDIVTVEIESGTIPPQSKMNIRCRKDRVSPASCDITQYFDGNQCDSNSVCTKPSLNANKVRCASGTLEAILDDWKDVNQFSVECNTKNLIVMMKDSIAFEPQLLRCTEERGCDLSKYEQHSCEDDNECVPPTKDSNELKCDSEYELQTLDSQWIKVQKISCDSNAFKWENSNGKNVIVSARCVRKNLDKFFDLSLCNAKEEECKKPSRHSNLSCQDKFQLQVKTKDEEWRNVKEITANSDKFRVKEDREVGTQPEKIRCVRITSCTRTHPLKSLCEKGNDGCDEIIFKDDVPNKCNATIVRKSKSNKETRGTEIYCDRATSEWKMKTNGGVENVNGDDNVYCEYEKCRMEFCRSCELYQNKYRCPKGSGKVAEYKNDSSRNFTFFTCKKGRWRDADDVEMKDTDEVECDEDGTASQGGAFTPNQILLAYIIILIFVILLIAILLAYIVCRLQGKGWLHTIVIAKIRGDKKKKGKGTKEKKEMKSGKKTSKGDSSGKGATKNTEKETSNVEPDIPSSAEPVKMSGEKVSAEGLSVTGASAEKFSSENTGGGGIAIPNGSNEPIDPMNPNVAYA